MQDKSLINELTTELSEALRDEFEERAGILEFDGGLAREAAEFAAVALIHRRHALELMGLYLIQLGGDQFALSETWSASPTLHSPTNCPVGLACVVRAMGGMALLTAPKSEESGVSRLEES